MGQMESLRDLGLELGGLEAPGLGCLAKALES